ncbi:MAG: DUF6455 family protein [Rhizobiaceae bacterium]
MGIVSGLARHFDLMCRMAWTTGVVQEGGLYQAGGSDLKAAMMRCAGCHNEAACREWLADARDRANPPAFCANAGYFRQIQAQQHPVSG